MTKITKQKVKDAKDGLKNLQKTVDETLEQYSAEDASKMLTYASMKTKETLADLTASEEAIKTNSSNMNLLNLFDDVVKMQGLIKVSDKLVSIIEKEVK